MRVPLSWLLEYVDPGLEVDELADVLTQGGLIVEDILYPTGGVRGIRVGEVRGVERVSGSDKLYLVDVFDGDRERRVVAGVANYDVGDRVPTALPGAELPGGLRIERRELFGQISDGMLASARELGISDDHRGILVLEPDAPVGTDLSEWLDLDDPVFDLEVTPDRGYLLSMHGVARDVAALTGAELSLPEAEVPQGDPGVPVTIADPERCRRFDARTIRGVRVAPSPAWLQRRLTAVGMRPVSNIVDATNHAMLETGNPIHAYDHDLLAGPEIVVRTAQPGEQLVTLDGVKRDLDPDDLLICDAAGPVALAGVMGGETTEINASTRDVFLEVANFSARTVLRTARRHRLVTEGSARWEKTVPPESAPLAATRCAALIRELAGGEVTGGADHFPNPVERPVIRLRPPRANAHLGLELASGRQRELLESIWCRVTPAGEILEVTPPPYRPDLRIEEDLYEEIVRLHGYDRVPETLPSTGQSGGRIRQDQARGRVRQALAGAGWTEALSWPFIADEDTATLGWEQSDRRRQSIALVNPLSNEEAVLRTSLMPGLLRAALRNANRQVGAVALFEIGRIFLRPTAADPGADGGPDEVTLPAEPLMLGLVAYGDMEPARFDRSGRKADLFDLLGGLQLVTRAVGQPGLEPAPTDALPFHPGRAATLHFRGTELGVAGELHPRVIAALGVPPRTVAGEIRLDRIIADGITYPKAQAPSNLPGVHFDVAVVVETGTPARAVEEAVRAGAGPYLSSTQLFDVYTGEAVGEGFKSLAYRVRLDRSDRQLTDTDEAAAIDGIELAVQERVAGRLRR